MNINYLIIGLLVGDFKLDYNFKSHQAKAYQAIPFEITIKGHGYKPLIENIIQEGSFTLFKEQPIVKSIATTKGTESTLTYNMALSNRKSFVLEKTAIKAFNPQTQKSYTLTIPKQNFNIQKVDPTTLLDKKDSPKPSTIDFSWLSTLFSYLMVFIAGYLTAISVKWNVKTKSVKSNPFTTKVKACNNEKELLQLLLATDNQKFKREIEELESIIYGKANRSFKEVQKKIINF